MSDMKPAPMNSLQAHESRNVVWRHTAAPGTEIEQIDDPAYWDVVNDKMRPFDRIEVNAPDFWAELLVLQAGRGFRTVVRGLRHCKLPPVTTDATLSLPKDHRLHYEPNNDKWRGERCDGGEWKDMTGWHASKIDAYYALLNHASLRG